MYALLINDHQITMAWQSVFLYPIILFSQRTAHLILTKSCLCGIKWRGEHLSYKDMPRLVRWHDAGACRSNVRDVQVQVLVVQVHVDDVELLVELDFPEVG